MGLVKQLAGRFFAVDLVGLDTHGVVPDACVCVFCEVDDAHCIVPDAFLCVVCEVVNLADDVSLQGSNRAVTRCLILESFVCLILSLGFQVSF